MSSTEDDDQFFRAMHADGQHAFDVGLRLGPVMKEM